MAHSTAFAAQLPSTLSVQLRACAVGRPGAAPPSRTMSVDAVDPARPNTNSTLGSSTASEYEATAGQGAVGDRWVIGSGGFKGQ